MPHAHAAAPSAQDTVDEPSANGPCPAQDTVSPNRAQVDRPAQPFVLEDPLGWFDQARDQTPVLWHAPTSSWYITRFDDVWRLLLDRRLGARSPQPFLRTLPAAQGEAVRPLVDFLARWPMFLDPPRHTAVRRILRPGFTPSEVTRVAQIVAQHAAASATALARPGKDALETMLRPACRAALSALLGILPDDLPRLVDWSERLMGFVGRSRIDDTVIHDAQQAFAQFTDFTERTLARAASPLARSVGAAVREGALQPPDAVAIYAQLVTGALDPTVTALTVALEALSRGHHYRDGYRSAPDGFVHEAVRLATPFHFAARRALRDLELRGQRIPAGDRVVLVLAAANRDPRRFDAPLEFRWDRTAAHVAFGRGRHACLGAQVAHHTLRAAIDGHLAQPDQLGPLDVSWHITMGMKWPLRVDIAGADR